jgi:tRNA pseudouridine55 synthase
MSASGVLIIDKPSGLTSHDAVNRARRILGERSVGHLGTLDPMATGVLPLVVGRFTRLAQFYTGADKTYEGIIRFGFATDTYDAEGDPVGLISTDIQVSLEDMRCVAQEHLGVVWQTPPPFSAKKIKGVPAYKLARKHQVVELKPVQVEVKEFVILGVGNDMAILTQAVAGGSVAPDDGGASEKGSLAYFRARVASGTYVRSIAHDIGQRAGCGAHLAALQRTRVAEFTIAQALPLDRLQATVEAGAMEQAFIHLRLVLPQMASVSATDPDVALIRNGQAVNLPEFSGAPLVKVFRGQRELVAIARRIAGTLFHPEIVFVG